MHSQAELSFAGSLFDEEEQTKPSSPPDQKSTPRKALSTTGFLGSIIPSIWTPKKADYAEKKWPTQTTLEPQVKSGIIPTRPEIFNLLNAARDAIRTKEYTVAEIQLAEARSKADLLTDRELTNINQQIDATLNHLAWKNVEAGDFSTALRIYSKIKSTEHFRFADRHLHLVAKLKCHGELNQFEDFAFVLSNALWNLDSNIDPKAPYFNICEKQIGQAVLEFVYRLIKEYSDININIFNFILIILNDKQHNLTWQFNPAQLFQYHVSLAKSYLVVAGSINQELLAQAKQSIELAENKLPYIQAIPVGKSEEFAFLLGELKAQYLEQYKSLQRHLEEERASRTLGHNSLFTKKLDGDTASPSQSYSSPGLSG